MPEATLVECGEGKSMTKRLCNVLYNNWIVGHSGTALPANMASLQKALASALVERPDIAIQLEEKISLFTGIHIISQQVKELEQVMVFRSTRQSSSRYIPERLNFPKECGLQLRLGPSSTWFW